VACVEWNIKGMGELYQGYKWRRKRISQYLIPNIVICLMKDTLSSFPSVSQIGSLHTGLV
jgi:hypothetical protein